MKKFKSLIMSIACPERSRRVNGQLLASLRPLKARFAFGDLRSGLIVALLTFLFSLFTLTLAPSPIFAQITLPANISLPAPTGSITSSTGLPAQIITKFLPAVIIILGFLAVFYIIFAGIRFIISRGDPEKVAEARSRLTYAIVGFIVLLLAFAATQLIDRLFLNSGAI